MMALILWIGSIVLITGGFIAGFITHMQFHAIYCQREDKKTNDEKNQ